MGHGSHACENDVGMSQPTKVAVRICSVYVFADVFGRSEAPPQNITTWVAEWWTRGLEDSFGSMVDQCGLHPILAQRKRDL